jgi:death-on-curing protein
MVILCPSVSVVKEIHAHFIKQYGVGGYMSEGMIEGCLERSMTYVFDFQPFPKLFLKAAALLYSYIVFHPFVDGNKRTAFQTTKLFLRLNGHELIVPAQEGFDFTKAIADLKITEINEIAGWLKKHSKRRLIYLLVNFLTKFVLLTVYDKPKEKRYSMPSSVRLLTETVRLYPD